MIYLDTSLLVALFVADGHSVTAYQWLSRVSEPLIVGDLARLEFADVISRFARSGRLTAAERDRQLHRFDEFCERYSRHRHSVDEFEAAERTLRNSSTKLAAPDALHLASALHAGAALATFDLRLAEAARRCGVRVEGTA